MQTLCESQAALAFLPADPFAARITALFAAYGANRPFLQFWVQTVEGTPTAAVSRLDGAMTLCCTAQTDYEELRLFVQSVGYETLLADAEMLAALGLPETDGSYMVVYRGGPVPPDPEIRTDYDLRAIHALLCAAQFPAGSFEAFAADVGARLQHGTASYAVFAHTQLDACAFRLFIGEKSLLLGAVVTDPASRGRGYASRLVTHLAQDAQGRAAYLFCRNDGLLPFYEKMGFVSAGRWAQTRPAAEKRGENQ